MEVFMHSMKNLGSKSIQNLEGKGKKILLRLDLNCPVENGKVTDDFRIQASLPTIQYLMQKGGRIILMSHLGRPKGKYNPKYSLEPVKNKLEEILQISIPFSPQVIGPKAKEMADTLQDGQIGMLENLRFEEGEEKNSSTFAQELASLGDIYINDAFGCSHRKHASVYGIVEHLPSYFGLLMEKEIRYYQHLQNPKRPFLVVVGGAKLETKLPVISHLAEKADKILIGGAMSYTFLKLKGLEIGRSVFEPEYLDACQEVMEQYSDKLELPEDHVIVPSLEESERIEIQQDIPKDRLGGDIGLETISKYSRFLEGAETIVWNGPLGAFEYPSLSFGTHSLALKMAFLKGKLTITGGGDIVAALRSYGVLHKFSWVSTGGGAFLELISGKSLPGIEAIMSR
ncbi:MAG: phosphoglycerate kinase [Planctomycetota bacterium]|nr:MAG: phosphoglycerate kinase [Planctomycetota bacterium]